MDCYELKPKRIQRLQESAVCPTKDDDIGISSYKQGAAWKANMGCLPCDVQPRYGNLVNCLISVKIWKSLHVPTIGHQIFLPSTAGLRITLLALDMDSTTAEAEGSI